MDAALERLKVQTRELANGLRVFAVRLPHVQRAIVSAQLNVGPQFETRATHGLSHFLEHMLYRGTQTYPTAHALVSAIERLGGYLDAMTYADHGVLSLSAPNANLASLIPIFAEAFQRPRLGEDDTESIEIERGIVREELLEELDARHRQVEPDNLVKRLVFGDHAHGLSITGSLASLERFDARALRRHHARHYTARNSVVGVVSALPAGRMLDALARSFRDLTPGTALEAPLVPKLPVKPWLHVPYEISQTSIRLCFRGVSARDKLEPATQLLLRTLDDGMSTRLYARLCDELGLCYDVSAQYEGYKGAGILDLAADTEHRKLRVVVRELLGLVSELRTRGPNAEELELAKRRHGWQLAASAESAEDLAEVLGFDLLTQGALAPNPLASRQAALEAVSLKQVRAAARANFDPEQGGLVTVGQLGRGDRDQIQKLLAEFH
ncbi:MAG: pitrilysin family protein [Polyangiaceae bacterium]